MYIVMELQNTGTEVANIVNTYSNQAQADQRYHTILAAAAVSNVYKHSAIMLLDDGVFLKGECYTHESTPAPVNEE